MSGNVWTAPAGQAPLGYVSSTPAVAAAATDLSPWHPPLLPGQMNLGTRLRLRAAGEITCTSGVSGTETLAFYINGIGTAFGTTPAILASSGAQTLANGTGFPWIIEWQGYFSAVTDTSPGAPNSGAAQLKGQGVCYWGSSLSAFTITPMPQTLAARTIAQTATGLLTNTAQYAAVVGTLSTTTDVTSVTCDELTCELIG